MLKTKDAKSLVLVRHLRVRLQSGANIGVEVTALTKWLSGSKFSNPQRTQMILSTKRYKTRIKKVGWTKRSIVGATLLCDDCRALQVVDDFADGYAILRCGHKRNSDIRKTIKE
jgi:hypothetical protein